MATYLLEDLAEGVIARGSGPVGKSVLGLAEKAPQVRVGWSVLGHLDDRAYSVGSVLRQGIPSGRKLPDIGKSSRMRKMDEAWFSRKG